MWHLPIGLGLNGVNDIRELDGFLDKENRYVLNRSEMRFESEFGCTYITNNIPVTFVSVELDGETTHISDCIGGSSATLDSRKAYEHGGGS